MILIDQNFVAVRSDAVGLDTDKAWGYNWIDPQYNTQNAQLVDLPTPSNYKPGQFSLVNGALEPNASYQPVRLTAEQFVAAMDANFDAKAKQQGYDSRITCALRAGYVGPFQAEGQAFAQWMDNSYAAAYSIMEQVKSGQRPPPATVRELLRELPQFDWNKV